MRTLGTEWPRALRHAFADLLRQLDGALPHRYAPLEAIASSIQY